jgi:predicted amidophosphoribosyltransferase
LPLTEYTFNEENAVDRIFYGRINIKKANSFLFLTDIGILKNLIHYLKYKNHEKIGAFLGDWYGQILKEQDHLAAIDFVIPVPLHRKKLNQRGYNQVALFAKRIAHHIDSNYADKILIKTANTKTQTKKIDREDGTITARYTN